MNEQDNPWTFIDGHTAYESPWIKVSHHNVLNPAGNPGTYSIVHFKKWAIGILPLDKDNYTWIVGQYRYPLETYTWEIPEGGGDRDTDILESAKRELQEETGIIAKDWELVQQLQLSNSATDEIAFIYIARDLTFTDSNPDEDEALHVRKIHFDELYELVKKGEVTDSLTVAAVLKAKLMMIENKG